MRKATLWLFVASILIAGCGSDTEGPDAAPEQLTGVIVSLDTESFGDVRGLELKVGDTTYEIVVDPDHDYGFPLAHLSEHLRLAAPVRIDLELRDDDLVALTIEDV